jgi:hypothetical protein
MSCLEQKTGKNMGRKRLLMVIQLPLLDLERFDKVLFLKKILKMKHSLDKGYGL